MIRISLVGQDTRFSPWRPGFESRMRNIIFYILIILLYYFIILKMKPWRNGSASDSRPEGWGFKSLWLHF